VVKKQLNKKKFVFLKKKLAVFFFDLPTEKKVLAQIVNRGLTL
jgi:hypothetical protein